jgi:ribonuclease P protein component
MVFAIECTPALAAPPSSRVVKRAESVSLPDLESLQNSQDFRRVLSEGERRRQGAIVLVRSPGRPGPPRFGLVVSKSSGNAVTRNRIKRRLRHAVGVLGLQPGMDYVIIANSQVAEVSFARIEGWLARAHEELPDV